MYIESRFVLQANEYEKKTLVTFAQSGSILNVMSYDKYQ